MQKAIKKKRSFTAAFKVQLMRELESGKPRGQISRQYEVDETQLSNPNIS